MSSKYGIKAVGAAVALALSGAAMANTNIDTGTTGDLFFNLIDYTNNTSYLFDTGVSQASFNGNGSFSHTFTTASDANYASFIAAAGASDHIAFSVVSGTQTTAVPPVGTVFFTSSVAPTAQVGNNIQNVLVDAGGFLNVANHTTTTSTTDVYLTAAGTSWGVAGNEGAVDNNLGLSFGQEAATPGTALAFYDETSNKLGSATKLATLSTFAGTWTFSNGTLQYSAVATPLPAPLLLLLSGLGMMGVVSRRGKSNTAI